MARLPTTIDFETAPIEPRPQYPPKPVSVSVWVPGQRPKFWAWGHPSGNNCTRDQVRRWLRDIWRGDRDLLFHEAGFDLEVAEEHLGLRMPPWHKVHDTTFLLFLQDPNAKGVALKPAAELYLGWPQDDQKPLQEWILKHVPEARRRPSKWEAWLSRLPGELAAKRADGDVRRTRALFEQFYAPSEAYDRERRFLPVRRAMEQRGIPVDAEGLAADVSMGEKNLAKCDRWLEKRLAAPGLNPDSANELADALEDAHMVDEWIMTAPTARHPEGQRSTGWRALYQVCHDRAVVDVLRYRGALKTQVGTFAKPWLEQVRASGRPRVYVRMNQVRGADGARSVGARTGRLSTQPNMQNVPNEPPALARTLAGLRQSEQRQETLYVPIRQAQYIDLRSRVCAPRGTLLGDHDYSQQELRLLAELILRAGLRSPLARAYLDDPGTKAHEFVRQMVVPLVGRAIPYRDIKAVNFGVLYGEGLEKLSIQLRTDKREAGLIRRACKGALGAAEFDQLLKAQGFCETVGGRICPVEPPSMVQGEFRTWEYKLINTAIQGSAADQLKEAMVAIEHEYPGILILSVHDEVLWQAARKLAKALVTPVARIMEECLRTTVPIVAEGSVGRTWRECH